MHYLSILACLVLSLPAQSQVKARLPQTFVVKAQMPDHAEMLAPAQVQMTGWLGNRVAINEKNRLLEVDLVPLLAGYKKKPGSHPWIGEHIGKWMHAATLAWGYTGDPSLRAKLDGAAHELIAAQEPDGYLGTYLPDKRFGLYPENDWDVWSHKYCLIGLLTYYQYTGDKAALTACRKAGDLLIATFGPGKKSILSAGTHMGMAATSVLEPIVLLYRHTGDTRYLNFAKYIVSVWDEPNGPKVLTTLTTLKSVNKTANGKAYEMLSNLVGLCELARATGEAKYLLPAQNGWADVVANQLYITGTASYGEHFHEPHDLPNKSSYSIGETCVTVTWIQLTSQLLRLTAEAKYGNELERSYLNHLAAAQRPDGKEWCYYTALEGAKPYGPGINCCVSSGPRGMAMAPQMVYLKEKVAGGDNLLLNLFESSQVTLNLGGQAVTVEQSTRFPTHGESQLTIQTKHPVTFGLKVRAPQWAQPMSIKAGNVTVDEVREGWMVLPPHAWKNGDKVEVKFTLGPKMLAGEGSNRGRMALLWGPLVMAYDAAENNGVAPAPALALCDVEKETGGERVKLTATLQLGVDGARKPATFVPFAEAGAKGSRYRIWLLAPGTSVPKSLSLFSGGEETSSREGNASGSIIDDDPESYVVTYNGTSRPEDWFAVALEAPVAIGRITYRHGRTFHDGGWFDASAGKPRIEIQRQVNGPWEKLGELTDYPATTATDSKGLTSGQVFTLSLKSPVTIVGIRVIGKPAHGDNPTQNFASCAELSATNLTP